MKCAETRTSSVNYRNKAMYKVSVEYAKGYGKQSEKPQCGMDGQTDSKSIVPSGETKS